MDKNKIKIRRFKKAHWPSAEVDYLECDTTLHRTERSKRIDSKGNHIDPIAKGLSLESAMADNLVELPCYVLQLEVGDIAIIDYCHTYHTVFVVSGLMNGQDRVMVSLTKRDYVWSDLQDNDIEIKALLGNTYDEKRITYGVDFDVLKN